jgi:type IV secretory pathway TrbF-like protein
MGSAGCDVVRWRGSPDIDRAKRAEAGSSAADGARKGSIKAWMVLGGLAVIVIALVVARWIGSRYQQSALAADVDRLLRAGQAQSVAAPATNHGVDEVPAPVARYLGLALPTAKNIQQVWIRQIGTLRTDVNNERWMPFEAEHIVVPTAPGFVWNARVRVAPLLHVRVRDELIEGRGSGQVSLLSAFTVTADAGTPEMNSGSLHRYLAEAVWYPTALLPSPNLKWSAIDATRALATLTNRGVTVSLEFRFADTGEVAGIYTPGRWGTFPGGYRQVPWEGHFRDYRERNGLVVPTEGDVGWYVDSEWHAVWNGRISGFEVRPER